MKRVKLVTWPCTTGTASTIVGERHEVGSELFVPVMLTPYRWVLCCHFTIPEGFHAVVHRCGAYAGSWKPGCHCASPWTKIQYMVPKHYATFDTPVKEVATKDNVMVKIDVSVVFRIKDSEQDVKNFVYLLGPERLEKLLQAYQEEAVRSLALNHTYVTIRDLIYKDPAVGRALAPEQLAWDEQLANLEARGATFQAAGEYTTLFVRVLGAKGFALEEQESNPYVVLQCSELSRKTVTRKHTLTPVWKGEFEFPVLEASPYCVATLHTHSTLGQDKPIGRVAVSLADLQEPYRSRTYTLTDPSGSQTGSIVMQLTLSRDGQRPSEAGGGVAGRDRRRKDSLMSEEEQRSIMMEMMQSPAVSSRVLRSADRRGGGPKGRTGGLRDLSPLGPMPRMTRGGEGKKGGDEDEDDVDLAHEALQATKELMNEQLGQFGVEVWRLAITNITLPSDLADDMEKTTTWQTKRARALAEQRYRLKLIDHKRAVESSEQQLRENLAMRKALHGRQQAREARANHEYAAETSHTLACVEGEAKARVLAIRKDAQLAMAELARERELQMAHVSANARAEKEKMMTQKRSKVLKVQAQAAKEVAGIEADALRLRTETEQIVASQLVEKRRHEARVRQLEVMEQLASNQQLALSGTNSDSVVAQLVAARNSTIALGLDKDSLSV